MKKKLVIMISGVIISIAIVTLIILYFCTDTFKSPEELFWTFAKQNNKILSIICNENAKVQKGIKEKNNYVSDGNINITVEKNEEMKNIDIATNTVHDVETERTYSKITLKEQENDLLKLFCIKDYNTYGIKCEDLLKHYIGVRNANLKNFAQKLNVNKEIIQYIPDSIDINDIEKEHLISTYSNIFIQNIPKTSYIKLGKKDIQIEEKSYEAKVYLLKLSGDEICNIIIKCLENSMKDEVLLQTLERNKIDNYKEIASNLIVKINEQRIEEEVKIEIYVNKKEVVRTSINIGSKYKLTIDYAYENNSLKLLIFLEISTENISYNSKIIVDKNEEDNFVTNNIIITPNINKPMYNYKIVNKIGKMENNNINNSIITTIMNENGIKVSSIYNQNIQVGANGEKIAELKDSSAVILNNYTLSSSLSIGVSIATILIIFFSTKIAASNGQKKAFQIASFFSLITSILLLIIMLIINPKGQMINGFSFKGIIFSLSFILMRAGITLTQGVVIPMIADCADYEVYKYKKNVPGLIGTLFSFVDKLVSSIGTSILSVMLLIAMGHESLDVSTKYTTGLFIVFLIGGILFPIIGFIINLVCMQKYALTKEKMIEISNALNKRLEK